MNKSEIQARIEKVESELATLKDDLEKCDYPDGIEQEKCWHAVNNCGVQDVSAKTKEEVVNYSSPSRPAYMPECRQVTEEDVRSLFDGDGFRTYEDTAKRAHKLGFRMKVKP